jgi:hypothetical protein
MGVEMMRPHERALTLDGVTSGFMLDWLTLLPDVTMRRFGAATAAADAARPHVDFLNTVFGLEPRDAGEVPEIVEHYRRLGVRPWFELMPSPGFAVLARALTAAGAAHEGFVVILEGSDLAPAPPPGVEVTDVEPADLDRFAGVLARGHEVREADLPGATANLRRAATVPGARPYLAVVDGEPAAAAILHLPDEPEVAYLANASTLPDKRRRGCQAALIARRLADARAAGRRRACVVAGWGTASHANLSRAGLSVAYLKAVWRLR